MSTDRTNQEDHSEVFTMTLKSFTTALLVAAALLGAAPVATADEDTFLDQIRQKNKLSMSATNGQLLRLGYVACQTMTVSINNGTTMGSARHAADDAVAAEANRMGLQPNMPSVMHITQDAEDYLC